MKITAQIYRLLVPKFIRKRILAKNLKEAIFGYYSGSSELVTSEIRQVLNYLQNNPIAIFLYPFQGKYQPEDIEVFYDPEKGLRYVLQEGKRLYFKKRWGVKRIQHSFNELTREQDPESPHRYLTEQFKIEDGEVLVDIGVAEGNFALGAVEKASAMILFETDREWIEALNATFEPWKEKVQIVHKFVGNVTNEKQTTLDDYFETGSKISFLKIDVDGAESRLLEGCKRVLSDMRPLKIALCTYHKQDDEKDFKAMLTRNGFTNSHSDGFMLYYYDKEIKAPYLRRGLIRGIKS